MQTMVGDDRARSALDEQISQLSEQQRAIQCEQNRKEKE
jgi:hypothetical protein